MVDAIRYAWRETVRRRSRSLWNMAGYVVAVGFLVSSVSALDISSDGARSALWLTGAQFIGFVTEVAGAAEEGAAPGGAEGAGAVDVAAGAGGDDGGARGRGEDQQSAVPRPLDPSYEGFYAHNNRTRLFSRTLIEEMNESENVRDASPFLSFHIRPSQEHFRTWILAGFDPANMESVRMASCSATDVVEGRFIGPDDQGMVLLEQTFAEAEQISLDDTISLGGFDFRVVGIISPGTRPAKGDIYMPLEEAVAVVNTRLDRPLGDLVNVVLVDGASARTNAAAQDDVRRILGVNATAGGYGCFNPASRAMGVTQEGLWLLTVIIVIGVLALAIRSQYSSVLERRGDIGILKAIGWSDRSVVRQIMAESFIQALLGGAVGCLAAVILFLLFPVGSWMGLQTISGRLTVDPVVMVLGLLLTAVAGGLAGVFPAVAAARMRPADILRRP